jgi:hypothetical protein
MTTRRPLLAMPLLLFARPLLAAVPSWRRDVSEVRVAGVDASAMAMRLGVPVRTVSAGIAEALNAGHLEAALLDPATARQAARLMGSRLCVEASGSQVMAIRRALPDGLRADLRRALVAA